MSSVVLKQSIDINTRGRSAKLISASPLPRPSARQTKPSKLLRHTYGRVAAYLDLQDLARLRCPSLGRSHELLKFRRSWDGHGGKSSAASNRLVNLHITPRMSEHEFFGRCQSHFPGGLALSTKYTGMVSLVKAPLSLREMTFCISLFPVHNTSYS